MRPGLEQLRLLVWLKWRLMWRTFRRHKSAAVGAVLAMVVFVPISLVAGAGCLAGFLLLDPAPAEHLLRGVMLAAYLLWLLSPLFGYALTEDYDISKLFLFPVSPRTILAGTIFGSVVDLGVLVLLPMMAAVVVGFTKSLWGLPVVVAAVGLFLFHTLALSQAVVLSSAGMLRSRRARDVMVVLFPLLLTAFYVGSQMLPHRLAKVNWSRVLESRTWEVVNYLPSGLAARAIGGAARGEYVSAVGFLAVLAAVAVGTLYAAGWLVELLYAGEEVGTRARRRKADMERESAIGERPEGGQVSWLGRRLSPVVQAVADKELKYIVRDPYFKHMAMMMVYTLAVIIVVILRPWRGEGLTLEVGSATLWGASGFVMMMECQILFNILGTEGPAAGGLFMFPSSRREMVIGKNAAFFAALSGVNFAVAVIMCALARELHLAPGVFVWMELATVMFIACGNPVSVYFPVRVVVKGWGVRRQSASRGMIQGLIYMAALGAAGCLTLPVLAAVVVPTYWISSFWLAVTIPVAVVYASLCYLVSLRVTGAGLLRREVEIAEALRREE